MRGQPGSIVNISSQMGHVGAARRTVYCASKHAMEGFTKAMAVELAPHGIRVNSIGPTFLETPLTRPFFENAAFKAEVLSKIKLGRLGQLDEVTGRDRLPGLGRLIADDGLRYGCRWRLDSRLEPESHCVRHSTPRQRNSLIGTCIQPRRRESLR